MCNKEPLVVLTTSTACECSVVVDEHLGNVTEVNVLWPNVAFQNVNKLIQVSKANLSPIALLHVNSGNTLRQTY